MRNPVSVGALKKEWFAGMDMTDVGAATGGLVASSMIPSLIIKDATTSWQKFLKIVLALASTAGAGFIARNFSQSAGRSAVAGGLAGTVVQAITTFTNVDLGRGTILTAGRRSMRSATVVSPAVNRSEETVQLITP